MIQYIVAGLVLGGIYALSATALAATYMSTGILNFSFGSLAYFVARLYYFLNTQHGWAIMPAAGISIVLVGPALGVFLYYTLFRYLALASQMIKVVATLGLSVCVPPIAQLLFGNPTIVSVPGLAPQPVKVFHWVGVPVTLNQLIVYGCVILTMVIGAVVLRYSDIGLRVRAMVDSPAMTSLSGTSPQAVAVGVWAVGMFLAGLVGVLSAPIVGLDPNDFTYLMAAAFAAVIAGRLKNLPIAVGVGLAMGIAGSLVLRYLPSTSSFTAAVIPSIPFVVTAIFLIYNIFRSGRINESEGVGGALDRAITPQSGERRPQVRQSVGRSRLSVQLRQVAVPLIVVAVLPLVMGDYWTTFLAQGAAFAVIFLSFTIVTGEGGMIWLCQITFAGVGALTAAQLATNHGWPVLLAVLAGGVIATPIGVIVGFLTVRLGPLYVALVTLTFGLLMDQLAFARPIFQNEGLGVNISPPGFAMTQTDLTYLGLVVFCLVALLIVNLRRSTTGLALNAVRWSEPGAKTIGLSVVQVRVIVAGLAAFVAGIGGALLAVANGVAMPTDYATLVGIIWFATLATAGIRSNTAALIAGLTYTLLPAATQLYLPDWFSPIPTILFGFGAIYVAKTPDGWVPDTGRQLQALWAQRIRLQPLGGPFSRVGEPPSGGDAALDRREVQLAFNADDGHEPDAR